MILFGCADGWIYCLGAAEGTLVWRFRAAPTDRLVSVDGQLESTWPVHGAVLIQNDALYAAAGRSSYLDGGIVLYRIDPQTGQQLSKTVIYHLDPETGQQLVPEARFNMEGTTSDILCGDGQSVYLKYFGFDRAGKRIEQTKPHLFAIAGLLGEDWFVRSYWVFGAGMPGAGWSGWADAATSFPAGRILSFSGKHVYGYGRQTVAGGRVGHRADAYHLFKANRPTTVPTVPKQTNKTGKKARRKPPVPTKEAPIWSNAESLIVRSMVLGNDRLAVAGPADLGKKNSELLAFLNETEALAGFKGERGVYLHIVSAADGYKLSELQLDAMPVFDGIAAARGQLYLATRDGRVVCLGE